MAIIKVYLLFTLAVLIGFFTLVIIKTINGTWSPVAVHLAWLLRSENYWPVILCSALFIAFFCMLFLKVFKKHVHEAYE